MADFKLPVDCHFNSAVATLLGVPEALLISRVHYFIEKHQKENQERFFLNYRWWMCETVEGFRKAFPFLSRSTVLRAIRTLEESEFIVKRDGKSGGSRINFYTENNFQIVSKCNQLANGQIVSKCNDDSVKMKLTQEQLVSKCNDDSVKMKLSFIISKSKESSKKNKKSTRESVDPPLPIQKHPKYDDEDFAIAKLWLEYSKREMSWRVPPSSWTEIGFAEALEKIRRETGLNHSGLRAVLNYVSNDTFWVRNALSPASLLKKSKNDVRKIDNILSQMKPQSLRQEEKISSWGTVTEEELNNPFG